MERKYQKAPSTGIDRNQHKMSFNWQAMPTDTHSKTSFLEGHILSHHKLSVSKHDLPKPQMLGAFLLLYFSFL